MNRMHFSWERLGHRQIKVEVITPLTEIGTLYRLTAAILLTGLDIVVGNVLTEISEDGTDYSRDDFILESDVESEEESMDLPARLGVFMETLLQEKRDPDSALKENNVKIPSMSSFFDGAPEIVFEDRQEVQRTVFYIETVNRHGLLFHLARILYEYAVDIKKATIYTNDDGMAQDTFELQYMGTVLGDALSRELERVIVEGGLPQ